MWRQLGRGIIKRGEAVEPPSSVVGKVRARFSRQESRDAQTTYGGALGLGVGALAVLTTIVLLLLLHRRATSQRSSTEATNEELNAESEE